MYFQCISLWVTGQLNSKALLGLRFVALGLLVALQLQVVSHMGHQHVHEVPQLHGRWLLDAFGGRLEEP